MDENTQTLLEIINHIIKKHPNLAAGVKQLAEKVLEENSKNPRSMEVFKEIYKKNHWGHPESVSGSGSTLEYTENIRKHLPILLNDFSINKIFDAPCGDFNWMRELIKTIDVDYIGADIVPELIESHKSKYQTDNISFSEIDITKDKLPQADLMICRDCLFHFSDGAIKSFIENFCSSDIKYLLTTTHINNGKFNNSNILTGNFRLLDLFSTPFNFPSPPLAAIDDWIPGHEERQIALWSREQMLVALANYGR